MRKHLLSAVAATVLLAGAAAAQTSTTTTTTWSADQGTIIRQHSTTHKYHSYSDPSFRAEVGVVLPGSINLYPLPETIVVPKAEQYSYSIINDRPVVVERTTRRVVHSWE